MITTVLFDMDGTLLPMDYDTFANGYFSLIAKKMAPYGFAPEEMIRSVWVGTKAMMKNDGSVTNEKAFWDAFGQIYQDKTAQLFDLFTDFYEHEFDGCRAFCTANPLAAKAVAHIREMGYRTAVATNPLFPNIAIKKRLSWTGVPEDSFEHITTYENSHFAKPNPEYYKEVAATLDVHPEECLMVGNDMTEDLAAAKAGMRVFIVDDCLINKENRDMDICPHGDFNALIAYIDTLGKR